MIRLERALVAVALAISVVMLLPPTSPLLGSSPLRFDGGGEQEQQVEVVRALLPFGSSPAAAVEPKPRPEPQRAKGLLMTGYTAGGSRFETLLALIRRTELNAVVIDIKDESGELSWIPTHPGANIAGAGIAKMSDPASVIRRLNEAGVYVIGRIVTFQDPILSEVRPDLAVRFTDGQRWTTEKGLGWVDPYSPQVHEYVLSIAKDAVSLGFDEIQFDYVRFPSDGDIDRVWYPHADYRPRTAVITEFLGRAGRTLNELGVYVSADLFGLVTLAEDDMGIGQRLELLAPQVDYVSLMLYPSHYSKGNYGIADPERDPGQTIALSIHDAQRRIAGSGAKLRPWIQDFSLRVRYSPHHVRAQINALEDAGVDEWLLWNAANRYTEAALRPARSSRS